MGSISCMPSDDMPPNGCEGRYHWPPNECEGRYHWPLNGCEGALPLRRVLDERSIVKNRKT